MIVGTDPMLSVLVALPWRVLRRRSRIVHWCFDLYPDAAVAEGMLRRDVAAGARAAAADGGRVSAVRFAGRPRAVHGAAA